jgi:hypothetical protein
MLDAGYGIKKMILDTGCSMLDTTDTGYSMLDEVKEHLFIQHRVSLLHPVSRIQ